MQLLKAALVLRDYILKLIPIRHRSYNFSPLSLHCIPAVSRQTNPFLQTELGQFWKFSGFEVSPARSRVQLSSLMSFLTS